MEFLGQQAITYQHKESTVGNLDRGRFFEHIQYKVVVGNQDKLVIDQNQHRLVDQNLGKLTVDQTQHNLVDQVQDKFGTIGIVVVGIVAATVFDTTVVAHQYKFDQVVDKLAQSNSESSQLMVNKLEVVGFQTQTIVVKWPQKTESVDLKLEGKRQKDQLAKDEIQSTELATVVKS